MRTIILITAAIVLLVACKQKQPAADTALQSTDTIPVKLMTISGNTSNGGSISASGSIGTEETANLSFKIGGVIESIVVKEGDRVRKGQLLATLKSAEIGAQVQQAQLAYEKAKRDYDRASRLYADSVVTLEQMQNAKTGVDIAQQALQQVSFNQQYSKIYAPADGFVVQKRANVGELASAGNPVLALNLSSGSSRWILKVGVSDADWAAIAVGNKATVSIDAFPTKKFDAVVTKRALAADPASGSFVIELQIDVKKDQPAVGMFGTALITPSKPSEGFNIPYDALLEADGRKGYVFVSDDKRTVKKVEVSIAAINNNTVSIADGLQGHRWIVISGSPFLTDASLIKAH
jgi:RND family efflux transporter MFP subunit